MPSAVGATECSPARERWVPVARVLSPSGAKDSCDQHLSALWASYHFRILTQRSRAGLHSVAPTALNPYRLLRFVHTFFSRRGREAAVTGGRWRQPLPSREEGSPGSLSASV